MDGLKPLDDMSLGELEDELQELLRVMEYESDAIWQSVYAEHKKELEARINAIVIAVYE